MSELTYYLYGGLFDMTIARINLQQGLRDNLRGGKNWELKVALACI
jgi:hypothetical protein